MGKSNGFRIWGVRINGWYLASAANLLLFAWVQTFSGMVEPISDDHAQIDYVKGYDSVLQIFQVGTYGIWRPTKNLLFYLVYQGGLPHQAFQYIGMFLACVGFAVTWWLLMRFMNKQWLAFLGASLWLWNPANTPLFNWASALNIACFYICTVLFIGWSDCLLKESSPVRSWLWGALSNGTLFLSLLSYDMGVTSPVLVWLYVWLQGSAVHSKSRAYALIGSNVMVVVAFLMLRQFIVEGIAATVPVNSLIAPCSDSLLALVSSVSFMEHLRLFTWPFCGYDFLITFDPDSRVFEAIVWWLVLLSTTVLGFIIRKRLPELLFFLLWSAFALASILNVIPIHAGPICEYYLSVPILGGVIALTSLLRRISGHSVYYSSLSVALLAYLFCCGFVTAKRQPYWASDHQQAVAASSEGGKSYRMHLSMADILLERQDFQDAYKSVNRAIEIAPWHAPSYARQLRIMKTVQVSPDQIDWLLDQYLEQFPDSTELWLEKAASLESRGEDPLPAFRKAFEHINWVNQMRQVYHALGVYYAKHEEYEKALEWMDRAYNLLPHSEGVWNNRESVRREYEKSKENEEKDAIEE